MSSFNAFRRNVFDLFDEFERDFFNDPFFTNPGFSPFSGAPAGPALTGPDTEARGNAGDGSSNSGETDKKQGVVSAPGAAREVARRDWPFGRAFSGFPMSSMPMDVVEGKEDYRVSLDLPGVKPDEVKVECKDGVLTVSGSKRQEKTDEQENYRYMERSFGSFSRSLRLPKDVDMSKVSAHQEDGVLRVTLPKLPASEAPVAREIPITTGPKAAL